ncbi:MAG: TIGR04283 family arsenosugar biosynthesis glycosyltransferase [Actinomycetota bacterium]
MVSIIIPVLNEEKLIAKTLEHFKMVKGHFEVIVVDGGSSDSTMEIAREFAKVIESPTGRATQMNKGAEIANGDILLFLHADTLLPPEAIDCIQEAFTNCEVVGGRFKISLDNQKAIYRIISGLINLRDRFTKGFTGDQGIFIQKDAFKRLGGFREFSLMEDLDLARRMRRTGPPEHQWRAGKLVRLPLSVTTSARRWEKHGLIRTILLMWLIRILFLLGISPSWLRPLYDEVR